MRYISVVASVMMLWNSCYSHTIVNPTSNIQLPPFPLKDIDFKEFDWSDTANFDRLLLVSRLYSYLCLGAVPQLVLSKTPLPEEREKAYRETEKLYSDIYPQFLRGHLPLIEIATLDYTTPNVLHALSQAGCLPSEDVPRVINLPLSLRNESRDTIVKTLQCAFRENARDKKLVLVSLTAPLTHIPRVIQYTCNDGTTNTYALTSIVSSGRAPYFPGCCSLYIPISPHQTLYHEWEFKNKSGHLTDRGIQDFQEENTPRSLSGHYISINTHQAAAKAHQN